MILFEVIIRTCATFCKSFDKTCLPFLVHWFEMLFVDYYATKLYNFLKQQLNPTFLVDVVMFTDVIELSVCLSKLYVFVKVASILFQPAKLK